MSLWPLRWNVVAPPQKPEDWDPSNPADQNYNWSQTDEWVKSAVAAGLTPVFQIRGAPTWAQRCTGNPEYESICNPDPAALAAFARAAARRYSGEFEGLPRVRYWEGVNEPNISYYFEPLWENGKTVAPALYRGLLEAFYGAIKAVNPENLVLSPALAPVTVKGLTIGPMAFTRMLLCMKGREHPKPLPGNCGGGVPFDIFDIHPYTSGSPTHEGGPNDVQLGDLGKLQELLTAAEKAGRIRSAFKKVPIWITEFSYDSNPPDGRGVPMKTEKQFIPEALYQAWLHKVPVFMWYSLEDNPSLRMQAGLYFWATSSAQLRPKPEMYAFRFPFVAIREGGGLKFWGKTPSGTGGKITLQAQEKGKWRQIAVTRANKTGIFHGRLRTSYGADEVGAVRALFGKEKSLGFPMKRVPDHPLSPFG